MSESNFSAPSQVQVTKLTIDGQDVMGIYMSLSFYEDIYRPVTVGTIVITDSDGAKFIDENRIEFIEPIEFTLKSALNETLEFKGVLNGLRNEYIKGAVKYYEIDFNSVAVRKNEEQFVVKSYRDSAPEFIVREMVEKMGGTLATQARGQTMQYLGARRRPADVIKYVLTHGLSQKTQATQTDSRQERASGTTGFLCWETVDGFKFETIDDILSGRVGTRHEGFKTRLANIGSPTDESMKDIVQVEFQQIGDYQTKLRSGAFGSINISFDMDTGLYKEYKYDNRDNMTQKQKEAFGEGSISRIFMRPIDNQKYTNTCEKAMPFTGDQSRKFLTQSTGRQNTFTDQTGYFTLYPQFKMRAGDSIDCRISKVKDEKSEGGYDNKHSGRYVIQAVAHHAYSDGRAYTRIKTIRSTTQQDDSSSQKS